MRSESAALSAALIRKLLREFPLVKHDESIILAISGQTESTLNGCVHALVWFAPKTLVL